MDDLRKMEILTKKSDLLKTIAHPMRLCILNCLMDKGSCNVTSLTEKMGKPQSTISQHLSKLRAAGIIQGDRKGVEIQYSLINDEVKVLIKFLLNDLEEEAIDQTIMC